MQLACGDAADSRGGGATGAAACTEQCSAGSYSGSAGARRGVDRAAGVEGMSVRDDEGV
jgi:hypothetical protein